MYFQTKNAAQLGASVKEKGGPILVGPLDVGAEGKMALCTDPEGAFYDEIFWTRSEPMGAPGTTSFTFVDERGRPQAGLLLMTEEWGDMPAHWMAYFDVEDADAACAAVKGAGGEVKHGPLDTSFGRMATEPWSIRPLLKG